MIINGVEIKGYQSKEDTSEYYSKAIKREVRQAINGLPFAQVTKITESQTTDSLYFEVQLNHFEEAVTVSIRTHGTNSANYKMIEFRIQNYKDISDLRSAIQLYLIEMYNIRAEYLLINTFELPSKRKNRRRKIAKEKEELLDEESRNALLEKAYRYEVLPHGWANLNAVVNTLGSRFKASSKKLGVSKLSKAYINSDLYIVKEVETNSKQEKWIKIKNEISETY